MAAEIKKALSQVAKNLNVRFYLHEKPLPYEEVFSETGLLPSIAKLGDQLCSLCLGYGLGLTFEDIETSLTGVKVIFDDATPFSLRLLCMTDILIDTINASPSKDKVSLDDLLYV